MEDSGAILFQISSIKDMLDQVNQEIEAHIQITREIESDIVKCTEIEGSLTARESELTKMVFVSQFEIDGLNSVAADSKTSLKFLEKEICSLRRKQDEILKRMNNKREDFAMICLDFQKDVDKGENDELRILLSEKEFLENEIHILEKKIDALENSMLDFVEEILEDLHSSSSGYLVSTCLIYPTENYSVHHHSFQLQLILGSHVVTVSKFFSRPELCCREMKLLNAALLVEIQSGNWEHSKLLKDIDYLKATLLSTISINNAHLVVDDDQLNQKGGKNKKDSVDL